MKKPISVRVVCLICLAFLLGVGSISCADHAADVRTVQEWRLLSGSAVKLEDLITPWVEAEYGGEGHPIPQPMPYFVGEVEKIEEDYLVLTPLADQPAGKLPTYAAELLKHGESVIVPLWIEDEQGEYFSCSADDYAVGNQIKVGFKVGRVSTDTVFGDALVIRVASSIQNVSD